MLFPHGLPSVDVSRKNEAKIGETIDVAENLRIDLVVPGQGNTLTFCATGYRTSQVQCGARNRSAGKDELLERRQAFIERVNFALDTAHVIFADSRTHPCGFIRSGEFGADDKKMILYPLQNSVDIVWKRAASDNA